MLLTNFLINWVLHSFELKKLIDPKVENIKSYYEGFKKYYYFFDSTN